MSLNLTPQIKANAIAAAITTTTGIQAEVVYPAGKNPKVTFTPANAEKLRKYVYAIMQKKGDVDIDIKAIMLPVFFRDVFPWAIAATAAVFIAGYITAKNY
jgi:hypothetical protein